MSRVEIRPASRADLEAFYGQPPTRTQKAIIAHLNGEPIGIGGVAYIDGMVFAFCDLKPEAKHYPVALVKAARRILNDTKAAGARAIFAEADPREPFAPRFLSHLGFRPTMKTGIWLWAR